MKTLIKNQLTTDELIEYLDENMMVLVDSLESIPPNEDPTEAYDLEYEIAVVEAIQECVEFRAPRILVGGRCPICKTPQNHIKGPHYCNSCGQLVDDDA
jgi:hypothetical protein